MSIYRFLINGEAYDVDVSLAGLGWESGLQEAYRMHLTDLGVTQGRMATVDRRSLECLDPKGHKGKWKRYSAKTSRGEITFTVAPWTVKTKEG